MRLPFKSIRWRVQLWHGVILLVVLAAFGGTAYFLTKEARFRVIDQQLQRRSVFVFSTLAPTSLRETFRDVIREVALRGRGEGPIWLRRIGRDGPQPPEPIPNRFWPPEAESDPFYHVLWDEEGAILERSSLAPANIAAPPVTTEIEPYFRSHGEYREHVISTPGGFRLVVGRSIAREQSDMNRLLGLLLAAGSAVMTFGLAGGWWLASRAIRPIQDISDTAGKIARGSLAERINISDTDNELGQLATTLNATFARLQTAFDEQTRAFARQTQFTADASHELRTPVSVVLTQAQSALSRARTPEEYRDALQVCERAAERMRRLVESLLTLARLDADEPHVAAEPCHLDRLACEAVDLLRPIAAQHAVALHVEPHPVVCFGDAGQLVQVVTNLVSNAIYYNRPGGLVRITTAPDGETGWVALTVSDTGQGMAAEDLPHIFERFYRADKARHGNGRTGLGLAIVKAIVEAHDGIIETSSQPGVGSTFVVRFPAFDPPGAAARPARPARPIAALCH